MRRAKVKKQIVTAESILDIAVITTESSELGPVDSQLVFSTQELCLIKIEENPCMDNSSKFGYETRTKRSPNRANPFD